MNVLIISENYYQNLAISEIIKDVMDESPKIKIVKKANHAQIYISDIIITDIDSGEQYFCNPNFKGRKNGSRIMFLTEKKLTSTLEKLPHCFKGAEFIDKRENISCIIDKITMLKEKPATSLFIRHEYSACYRCPSIYLTLSQLNFSHGFMRGLTLNEMAFEFKISLKTIHSQKRRIMSLLDVNTDKELFTAFNGVKLIHSLPLTKE